MRSDLKVTNIYNVFEGEFSTGVCEMKKTGRHSDAFACIVEGSVEYIFKDRSFIATSNSFFYLPKGSKYAMKIKERSKFICIDFDFNNSDSDGAVMITTDKLNVKREFEFAFREWLENDPWKIARVMSTVYSLYTDAIKTSLGEVVKKKKTFSLALDIILERYTDPYFTVSEISEGIGISDVHLRRIFSASVGMSPIKYINYLRIEKAKNILLTTDYTVEKIAALCGFADQYYFSRIFSKAVGVPPSKYRVECSCH